VLLCVVFGGASAAQAACYGSTPANVSFADSPFDGSAGLAPEITTVQGALDGACNYSVVPGLTDSLVDGDAVFVHIDRDNNPATGDPTFRGADIVVGTLGVTGTEGPPVLGVWNGSSMVFTDPSPVGAARNDGGFSASVDRLGLSPDTLTRFSVSTMYSGIYDNYVDFAPEPGASPISLPVAFSTTPPLPPPPPTPPAPAAQPVVPPATAGCRVPFVRGKTRWAAEDKLFGADCNVASTVRKRFSNVVRKGRVITTTPGSGARTTKAVRMVVSKGRRKHSARAAGVDGAVVSMSVLARLQELANSPAARP
jgi:hypothetical protein